ncbi:MAG: hypothetical protein M1827_005885 [Pycnora praestabilis]|nr:MAG: hypothetical protein M1827_005885 [Pycnora praestabilis]
MHALFDKDTANNRWAIQSRVLREFVEHFGPKTEQLDIYSENGRATFTSYTEKIMDGKEILKQPLQTSVAIETLEFEEFSVQEKLHVAISVKDFKAIVTHADTLRTSISALYSQPTQPLQLAYQGDGMQCEFTLMTIGDFRGNSVNPAPAIPRGASARSFVGQNLSTTAEQRNGQNTSAMPPPAQVMPRSIARESTRQRERKPSPPAPKASLDSQSLFIPEDDDDRRWDEPNYGNEDEDTLGWDASADNDGMATSLERSLRNSRTYPGSRGQESNTRAPHTRLPPTQRVDEVPGLFD